MPPGLVIKKASPPSDFVRSGSSENSCSDSLRISAHLLPSLKNRLSGVGGSSEARVIASSMALPSVRVQRDALLRHEDASADSRRE
eukprot:5656068-Pleurochrysis_carterae.AAC.1